MAIGKGEIPVAFHPDVLDRFQQAYRDFLQWIEHYKITHDGHTAPMLEGATQLARRLYRSVPLSEIGDYAHPVEDILTEHFGKLHTVTAICGGMVMGYLAALGEGHQPPEPG